ncbi:MAG TPA: Plug domain-containing protein [Gemmatimonadaceae bacterium]|nr:Plug domain-containing protein [Gemmatimonadaceae bacterium]
MTHLRLRRCLLVIGLGVVAGAVLPESLRAQVPVKRDTVTGRRDTLPTRVDSARAGAVRPPAGRDTLRVPLPPRADSVPRGDTTRAGAKPAKTRADTMKAALTRAPAPPTIEIGPARIYDRAALFATGSLTLSDLLGRVPGLTEFTTGWLGAPSAVASLGNVRRVRLFLDGVEVDPLDPRQRGVAPTNDLPIHALEEVRIERGVDEVRVYARSWRVERTTTSTRADVATGDQNTNLYRAFFGRRFAHGEAFQLAAEQYSTQPIRALPSSDALNLMLRVGTARGPWSGDLFVERSDRNRGEWVGVVRATDTVPGLESRRTLAYARLGYGDPDVGNWVQLTASANDFRLSPRGGNDFNASQSPADSSALPDTTTFVGQYLLAAGTTIGPFSVSATERLRTFAGRSAATPSARAMVATPMLAASVFAEGSSPLNTSRIEATARLSPLSRIAIVASASRTGAGYVERMLGDTLNGRTIDSAGAYQPGPLFFYPGYDSLEISRYGLDAQTNLRAEAGVRLGELWISGGLIRRGATTLLPPAELIRDTVIGTAVRLEGKATARTVAMRGRLFKSLYADAWGIAWDDTTGLYRPRYQSRGELYIQTNLLNRFPSGNFGLFASLAHEYRSTVRFALPGTGLITAGDVRTVAFRLEIRVQTAVVSYQFRNLLQERYQLVPGFYLPRQTQFYGVRWDFWN